MPSSVEGSIVATGDVFVGDRDSDRSLSLRSWGIDSDGQTLVLSRLHRRASGAVSTGEIGDLMRSDPRELTRLLPPFGAVAVGDAAIQVVTDAMGFQPVFHTTAEAARPVVSSSALVAARVLGARLDEASVGVQSLLGWQLGQHTCFEGVHKLSPGGVGSLDANGVRLTEPVRPPRRGVTLDAAVAAAAEQLRRCLDALLDDHPDAVLQLTGGLDSRLLLSAVPPARRRGLRAMTLSVPGSNDVAIARAIAGRFGMDHDVKGLAELTGIDPSEAWQLVVAEATRLDAMADPVALAAQRVAERNFPQGVRISGLGGEITRGFYYVGRVRDRGYDRGDAAKLAAWRMFVNDAVEPGLLTAEFAEWAREVAVDRVYAALLEGGPEWFRATDTLYARHRMQRWAGATDVAVSNRRTVVNPMLDPVFLDTAHGLAPADKQGARFLARVQLHLDPELAALPLDGRPSPAAYAYPPRWAPLVTAVRTGQRLARKALQRARRGNRPPAGGEVFAGKVVEHLRSHPELVAPLAPLGYVQSSWVDDVIAGRIDPRPSSVAFVVNLLVALDTASGSTTRL